LGRLVEINFTDGTYQQQRFDGYGRIGAVKRTTIGTIVYALGEARDGADSEVIKAAPTWISFQSFVQTISKFE
jgi:hypothetical protein